METFERLSDGRLTDAASARDVGLALSVPIDAADEFAGAFREQVHPLARRATQPTARLLIIFVFDAHVLALVPGLFGAIPRRGGDIIAVGEYLAKVDDHWCGG